MEIGDMSTEFKGKINSLESLRKFLSESDNTINQVFVSDIPQICKDEPCLVGIDEAGRGPVLGPMVYGIAFCPIEKKKVVVDLGCADSKELSEQKREEIFESIHKEDFAKETVGWAVDVIAPSVISALMLRRSKYSLNQISMDSAIGLIKKLIAAEVNIAEIYVDTVGPPEKYQIKLAALFPDYQITVAKKADSTFPIVSMASICAKVTRDHSLKVWKFPEGLDLTYEKFGSGYPNDPITKKFLAENIDPVFGYPRLVRFSWATAQNALKDIAYDMEFEDDSDKRQYGGASAINKFFKSQTKDGKPKREKHRFFAEARIDNVNSFD